MEQEFDLELEDCYTEIKECDMKVTKGTIHYDKEKGLYWVEISFLSEDQGKRSVIFACSSEDLLAHEFCARGCKEEEKLNSWTESIVEKWSHLREEIFNRNVHFDVYANTQQGETKGIKFLLEKAVA